MLATWSHYRYAPQRKRCGRLTHRGQAMTEILDFKRPEKPKEPPPLWDEEDRFILECCARWREARALQQKKWAELDRLTLWGHLPDAHLPRIDLEPLEEMQRIEDLFSQFTPKTMLSAI